MTTIDFKKTSMTMIGQADASTINARYGVRYTVVGSDLQSVEADVLVEREVEVPAAEGPMTQAQEVGLGTIRMVGGTMMTDNLAYSQDLPAYMADFVAIVGEILHPSDMETATE